MARQPSWEDIAHTLASRLMHHAYCENRCETTEDKEDCPFCRDIAAYQAYLAKCRSMGRRGMIVSSYDNEPVFDVWEARKKEAP